MSNPSGELDPKWLRDQARTAQEVWKAGFKEGRRLAFEEAGRWISEPLKIGHNENIKLSCCDEREDVILRSASKHMWAKSRE